MNTYKRYSKKRLFYWRRLYSFILPLLMLTSFVQQSYAQTKILAKYESRSGGNSAVSNWTNVNTENNDYAEVKAYGGAALGIGAYSGSIQMKFDDNISADQWSYIRVELDGGLTDVLLGGTLGDALGGIVSGIALGDLTVEVSAIDASGNTVLSRDSNDGFNTNRVRLIQTGEGHYLIGLKPSQSYNRVKFKASSITLLLGTVFTNKVYNAFTFDGVGGDCGRPLATSFDGSSGIGLEVLGGLVDQKLGDAIDTDLNSFSTLKTTSVLAVDVANFFSQQFYFPSVSNEHTTANIKLALGSEGVVNTDLLGGIEVAFWNGGTEVYHRSLQNGLLNNTDALALLASGEAATLTFAPGRAFDRIEVRLNSTVGLNVLGDGVRIYDVQRYDGTTCNNPLVAAKPTQTPNPFQTPSCASGLIDFENVDFAQYAVDGNNESFSTLHADSGGLLVGPATAGFIEMDLGNVPANKTTYVRINYDEDVLDRLLGGSLGKLVGDLANNLLLGNQYIQVEALDGSNIVLNENSSDAFEGQANGVVSLVEDNIGRYYIAITPDSDYTSIRITNHVEALLPTGKKASLDVYNACFEIGTDSCFPANFTSYKGGGIGLNVGNISQAGVTDAYKAISDNSSDYSEINLGVAGVAANVFQTVYFSHPSEPNDKVKIQVAIEPSSSLSLDVLGRYQVKFFNGNTQVGSTKSLESGVINNLDLLALFNSGGIVELEYEPEGTFDRVDIGAESIASVNVATEPLRVYNVERYGDDCPLTIGESPFLDPSCATELLASDNADNVQNLFDNDFDSFATLKSGAESIFGIDKEAGFVELGYDQPVSANTTSYIRIDFDQGILDALVSGSLGNIVTGLLDGLVLGDHSFKVEVKDATGSVIESASSNSASAGGNNAIRVVQDSQGRYYIAVTPDQEYQSVKITDETNSGLLAQPNTMHVYGMCHETSQDFCLAPFATSYEYTGVNLSVNDLSGAGVTNASNAINNNSTNNSEISNGTLGVGTTTKQWIFFNSVSEASDTALIKFKTGAGGVDLDVLGGLEIKAYLGDIEVATLDWQNGLINGVNVLDLINNGDMVEVPFTPGTAYDRISVGIKTLTGVSVFPPVELYDVSRCYVLSSSKISVWKSYVIDGDVANTTVSGGEEVEYTIHVKNTAGKDLAGFTISDELPEGLTWVSGGTHNAGTVSFSMTNAITVDETKTFTFKAKVKPDLTGIDELKNIAYVQLNGSDENVPSYPPVDNTTPDNPDTNKDPGTIIPVQAVYDYSVLKNGISNNGTDSNQASVGDEITYTISVENTGNKKLTNLSVTDVIQDAVPAEIEIINDGGGSVSGNEIAFTISELNVGDITEFTVITKVAALPASGEVTNKAMLSYTTPDNIDIGKEATFIMASNCLQVDASAIELTDDTTNAVCGGTSVELTANLAGGAPALTNPVYKWYENQDLSDTPEIGESITVNPASTTTYYVTVEDVGYCYSGNPKEIEVEVLPNGTASDIEISGPNEVCLGEEVVLSASLTTGVTITNPVFKWYLDADLTNMVFEGGELDIIPDSDLLGTHTLYVTVEGDGVCANMVGNTATKQVTVNPKPTININGSKTINVAVDELINWPAITAEDENGNSLMVNYFDNNGNSISSLPTTISTVGTYTYNLSAEEGNCASTETLVVNIYDTGVCPPTMERVYATDQSWGSIITGGVSNRPNAVDGNPKTYSTITTGLGLLGIGTTWQTLKFDNKVDAGTPVTIKLGKEYSGLAVAGGLSVVGVKKNGSGDYIDIGVIQSVDGGLLDLLVADNVVEYTFVPSNTSGAQDYDGVRISQGSLVGVAQNAKVYGAYYEQPGAANCNPIDTNTNPDVQDVLHGVRDLGLGVASATASVVNPWNAVDNDDSTYAELVRGLAVENAATLTVVFKQTIQPTDEVRISAKDITSNGANLNLLTGYSFQRYMGNTPVGDPIQGSDVLNLKLLYFGGGKQGIYVDAYNEPYDRIEIALGSVVQVALSDQLKIFDVSVLPKVVNQADQDTFEVCQGDMLYIKQQDNCTVYEVTDENDVLLDTQTDLDFKIPADTPEGTTTYFVQAIRQGCAVGPVQEIEVEVLPTPKVLDYEVKINNEPAVTYNPNLAEIDASPGDHLSIIPNLELGTGVVNDITWEIQNPNDNTQWIPVSFGQFNTTDGTLDLEIPEYGELELPDGTFVDMRNTTISFRLFVQTQGFCDTTELGLKLKIDGKSQLMSNQNITNKLKK